MGISDQIQNHVNETKPNIPDSTVIASIVGTVSFGITLFIYYILQRIFQDLPPYQLVEAMQGSSNSLCFAGMTSSATILPLMLTIFSFAKRAEVDFDHWFYARVQTIAIVCCLSFFMALFTLVILSAPIGDVNPVGPDWYRIFYYIIVAGISSMVALLTVEITMLYYAIRHILYRLDPRPTD